MSKIKNIKNKFLALLPLGMAVALTTSCSTISINYNAIYKEFENSQVVNQDFIKGGDISSYAEVIEEFLWSQKIVKTNLDGTVTNYRYDELETTKIYDESLKKETTLYEYVNNHMFSYIDENNEKQYNNLLHILKNIVGLNSLRIRTFVNPYDLNGTSYGGSHNDLNTTIWIIKEIKKYGFNSFNLNFHYSDFWADPHKQFVPKQWSSFTTEEIIKEMENYTFNTLTSIYEATGIYPNIVQIGNEITNGLIWHTNKEEQVFDNGWKNYDISAKYVEAGIKGVKKFEESINVENKIQIGIHMDDSTSDKAKSALSKYFENQYVFDNTDIIYLTWYPMWQKNFDFLFRDLTGFYNNFGKEVQIVEFSNTWTENQSNYSFDLTNRASLGIMPYTASGQMMMTYQLMETLSKAFPEQKTGFYYWEPAWSQVGRTSWATHEGILYSYNTKEHDANKVNEGNSWWNYSFFDNSNTLLPGMRVIEDYERTNASFNVFKNTENRIRNNLKNPIKNKDNSFYDSWIANQNPLKLSNNFYKINIKNDLVDFDNPYNNNFVLDVYENINESKLEDQIIEIIKTRFTRINWDEANISNIEFDKESNSAKLLISSNENSFLYDGSQEITINFKDYTSNSIDLSNIELSIDKDDTNWSKIVLKTIKDNVTDLGTEIWNRFGLSGDINDDYSGFWFYDQTYKQNRDVEWLLLKNDNVYMNSEIANFNIINENKYEYPSTLSELTSEDNLDLYFGIKTQINSYLKNGDYERKSDLSKIGTENWVNFPLLTFKLKINLI